MTRSRRFRLAVVGCLMVVVGGCNWLREWVGWRVLMMWVCCCLWWWVCVFGLIMRTFIMRKSDVINFVMMSFTLTQMRLLMTPQIPNPILPLTNLSVFACLAVS